MSFKIKVDQAIVAKIELFDFQYHQALFNTLTEWQSEIDDEVYRDL